MTIDNVQENVYHLTKKNCHENIGRSQDRNAKEGVPEVPLSPKRGNCQNISFGVESCKE
jgi:hypothetical protein